MTGIERIDGLIRQVLLVESAAACSSDEYAEQLGIVNKLKKELAAALDRSDALVMAVERKFPGETRHQTALRYIREAELSASKEAAARAAAAALYSDPSVALFGKTVAKALSGVANDDSPDTPGAEHG